MIIAGIKRRKEFSPNHIDNDAAIFNHTVAELRILGFEVNEYEEDNFVQNYSGEKLIVHMARHSRTIKKLKALEQSGCRIVNSTMGIGNCARERMTHLLLTAGVPHPESLIVTTGQSISETGLPFHKLWIKRGDAHAVCADDVCFVENREQLDVRLADFSSRNIKSAVINQHLEGDLVKFYGVTGSAFFHWFYPNTQNHSKFGQEQINGIPKGILFSEKQLFEISQQAAQTLQLDIWGGDAIVSPDGTIRLIDFNDFPSFKPCREEAAKAIAWRVVAKSR